MSFLLGNHGAHMLNGNTVQIFNILYWNINGMKLEKLEKIEKYLQKHQTTILCVAETWFIQDETYKKHKFFHTESIKGNKDHQGRFSGGLAIFAHNNIQDKIHILEQHTLHLTIRIETKIMTFIYFKPSLESIFINDHLNNHISHKPNILMGDFNANFFTGEKLDRQEAILQYCQPNRLELKSFNSRVIIKSQTDSEDTKNNCDFIFASNDVIHNTITYTQPKNFNINSDHGLLTINQVHFPKRFQNITQENTPTHTSYNVWKFQKDNQIATKFRQYYENYTKNKFTELKQKHSQLIPIENRQQIINDLTKFIENSIHNTCKTILGQKHHTKRKHYRKSKLILLLQKSTNSSDANHLYKLYKHDNHNNTPEGNITEAAEHFENLYKTNTESSIQSTIPEVPVNTGNDSINRMIINQCNNGNIYNIIKNYSNSKCAGPEKIPVTIINELKESKLFIQHLIELFKLCVEWEITPTEWNSSLISAIPKNNNSKFTPQNSRGIAITAIFRRLFEKMLLKTTELDGIKEHFTLHPNQAGFTKKVNTIPNLMLLHDSLKFGRTIKVFIDLKAAYDKTDIKHILNLLIKRNVPTKLINLIKQLFTNCFSSVIFNDTISDKFYRETGIFQGSLLAQEASEYSHILNKATKCNNENCSHKLTKNSKLSNDHFYCPSCHYAARTPNNVTTHINRNHPGNNQVTNEYQKLMPHFLLFADDIALNGRNQKETQQLLDIIGKWCTDYGMSPGFTKCNYISDKDINLKLLDNQLDRTESYKYLGLPITHKGIDFPSYMENQFKKTKTEFQRLKLNGNYFANSAHRINVLKSHVLSHLEYAIQLISLRTQAQNSNIKTQKEKITNLIKDCRKWANAPIVKIKSKFQQ